VCGLDSHGAPTLKFFGVQLRALDDVVVAYNSAQLGWCSLLDRVRDSAGLPCSSRTTVRRTTSVAWVCCRAYSAAFVAVAVATSRTDE